MWPATSPRATPSGPSATSTTPTPSNDHFPVAQMLNAAGYYTEPTAQNVAVSLLAAQVDTTDVNNPATYLTENLTGVYTDPDPRTYPLSSYSYLILPTKIQHVQLHHGQGSDTGRLLLLRHVPGPAAVGCPRVTRRCPSTWWRPVSPRSPRSPGPSSRTSTSRVVTTRPSRRGRQTSGRDRSLSAGL